MAQKRLSDELFKDLLFKELNSGNEKAHLKTNFFEHIRVNYSINKKRALSLHSIYYKDWIKLRDEAKSQALKSVEHKNIENHNRKINFISEKLLNIINKISIVEEKAYDIQLGKVVVYNREPNPMEIIEAIKEYNRINGL